MTNVKNLRKLLAAEYGIKSDMELAEVLKKMQKMNIGVLVSPITKAEHGNNPLQARKQG